MVYHNAILKLGTFTAQIKKGRFSPFLFMHRLDLRNVKTAI